jgi:hypothetical protein
MEEVPQYDQDDHRKRNDEEHIGEHEFQDTRQSLGQTMHGPYPF